MNPALIFYINEIIGCFFYSWGLRIFLFNFIIFVFYLYIFYPTHVYRVFLFWYWGLRPFLHYFLYNRLEKHGWITLERKIEKMEELHTIYAPWIGGLFCALRGYFCKVAQRMSTRPDVYPVAFISVFEEFLSNCPPEPFEDMMNIVKKELNINDLKEVFSELDEKPLGAASIGQVYRARLLNGSEVAIKIQYPWVEKIVYIDFWNFKFIAWCFHEGEHKYLEGVEKVFKRELDFKREARLMTEIQIGVEKKFPSSAIIIPKIIPNLCTDHIIVMTFLEGKMLSEYCKKMKQGRDLTKTEFKDFTPPDEIQLKVIRGALNLRQKCWNTLAYGLKHSFGTLLHGLGHPTKQIIPYQETATFNVDEVIHTLIDVTGYQMLILGKFNTDPHAGNLIINKKGRLGLIDFGQVCESTLEHRKAVAKLMLALLRRNKTEVVKLFKKMGFRTKEDNDDTLFMLGIFFFDCLDWKFAAKLYGTNDRRKITQILRKDPLKEFPPEYYEFVRVSMVLRGVCLNFLTAPSLAKCWEKYCIQVLEEDEKNDDTFSSSRRRRKSTFSNETKTKSKNMIKSVSTFLLKLAPLAIPKPEVQLLFN